MRTALRIWTTVCIIIALSQGCEPESDDALVRHFTIRKGHHYAKPKLVQTLQSDGLIFEATFDQSAMYDLHDEALQTAKNKLFGFADCNSLPHQNSARFAWQWFHDQLEIYTYCYADGSRIEEFIGTVNIGETNRYIIEVTKDFYTFHLNEKKVVVARSEDVCDTGIYYLLLPYFGGSVAAPHDIHIALKILV